ncbi:hypothetical protein TRVL_04659 [Trypanosoma vivax]|nr:hypothetical protein TRVL_04659 [Trypanosoma vivax]
MLRAMWKNIKRSVNWNCVICLKWKSVCACVWRWCFVLCFCVTVACCEAGARWCCFPLRTCCCLPCVSSMTSSPPPPQQGSEVARLCEVCLWRVLPTHGSCARPLLSARRVPRVEGEASELLSIAALPSRRMCTRALSKRVEVL